MTLSTATYTVGRGKPPLHTRFQKGQSGNPSGKPGPAKLAKQRFERALYAALEASETELEQSQPEKIVAGIARRMALDAVAGRMSALKLVLTLLDAESGASARGEEDDAEELFTAADLFSLLQGKRQGNEKTLLEDILWPEAPEKAAHADVNSPEQRGGEPAPSTVARERNEAEPLSLLQGKTQGNDKNLAEQICPVSPSPFGEAQSWERREPDLTPAASPMLGNGAAGLPRAGDCLACQSLTAAPGRT
ncbi:MAG TPA: DUF5681 domain-containing protein [Rhizomicrobium sp.]|jgi:hypothetical protein|nr:DUF5681 domain-containing protein [Rhizomicrobium sp.]